MQADEQTNRHHNSNMNSPVRRIPAGWTRWYLSPPIQWEGVPAHELLPNQNPINGQLDQRMIQINF